MIEITKRTLRTLAVLAVLPMVLLAPGSMWAAQTFTDDTYAAGHTAATDLQNIENNFAALKSAFSGGSAPANAVAGMWWFDTSANILKLRNEANDAWLNVYDFANSRALDSAACSGITLTAGTGLSGGGDLSTGRTISVANAGIGATQLAAGAVTAAKMGPYTAGDYPEYLKTTEYIQRPTSYTKIWECPVPRAGTIRVRWEMKGTVARSRIYVNGSAVGTEKSTADGTNYSDQYSDISVTAGDLVQIYARTTSSDRDVYIRNSAVCHGSPFFITPTWSNIVHSGY